MTELRGLSAQEVAERQARGDANNVELDTSRTYGQIIRKNVFNTVNIILFFLGGSLLLMGRVNDALNSAGLILLNAAIGSVQEVRAKRKLDEIALLARPKIRVIRESVETVVDPSEIVLDDLIVVVPGDQVVVDGVLLDGSVEMDESLLTGESDAIEKAINDEIMSGSFCLSGRGIFRAEKVGADSYAHQITATAREFTVHRTPLQNDVDYLIRFFALLALILGFFLFLGGMVQETPFVRTVQIAAVITGIIPIGTYLMTMVSYALGAVRLLDHGALIQEPNALESLSNVDILCTDKTGTLTANKIVYNAVYSIDGKEEELEQMLGDLARSSSATNTTSEAMITGLDGAARIPVDEVTFSSARKWSALAFDEPALRGAYVLGALEMLEPHLTGDDALSRKVEEWSNQGLRVMALAHNPDVRSLHDDRGDPLLPDLRLLGLISFRDELRPQVQETIQGFKETGVQLKVISGDNPNTVAALAKQAGLSDEIQLVSGSELAEMSESEFGQAAEKASIFGRITPDQKERLVDALRRNGHYVAMIGDGVNDVLSLKKANLGIAMESGSAATRGVADIVLLNDSFGAMVPALTEGKRIVSGMANILRLFVARTASVAMIFLAGFVVAVGTPFLPGNNAAYALMTVSLPTFALAYWARPRQLEDGRMRGVVRMSIPAAVLNMIFGIIIFTVAYGLAIQELIDVIVSPEQLRSFEEILGFAVADDLAAKHVAAGYVARSAMTAFLIFTGLFLIILSEPPTQWLAVLSPKSEDIKPTLLAIIMTLAFAVVMAIPFARSYFELVLLPVPVYFGIGFLAVVWLLLLRWLVKIHFFERFLERDGVSGGSGI